MLKDKDKPVTDDNNKVVCGVTTSALARHILSEDTLQAIKDVAEGRDLYEYESYEALKKDILCN